MALLDSTNDVELNGSIESINRVCDAQQNVAVIYGNIAWSKIGYANVLWGRKCIHLKAFAEKI